jgi:YHS domain-containing protein
MKNRIILIAAAALLPIACNSPAAESTAEAPAAEKQSAAVDDIGGEQTGPIYTKTAGDTLALSGYDAVSYFGETGPVEGSADHVVRYQGHDYRFASAENAATFKGDPAKYAPQYGGYCAWAIGANNALATTDPTVYKIVDGKLYLNFSKDVAKKWEADIAGFIVKGDKNYPTHSPEERYDS